MGKIIRKQTLLLVVGVTMTMVYVAEKIYNDGRMKAKLI